MSYTKTTWRNNNSPAINQTNLNKIEQGIKDLETKINTILTAFNNLKTTGEIGIIANNNIPNGWLLCDGTEVSKTTYSKLYAVIGDAWGTATDTTKFKLPDLIHKTLAGQDTTNTNFTPIGKSDGGALGAWRHAHTASQSSHNHTSNHQSGVAKSGSKSCLHTGSGNSTSSAQPGVSVGAAGSTTNQLGVDVANMPPYSVIKYIICTGQ